MKYRNLGRSALKVSELCLGTMNFGPRTPEADAFRILDEATAAGVNFIDTANQYGGHKGVGTTETILGRWLQQHRDQRDKLVIATKVYEPMSEDVNDRGLSARHIIQACEASLKRLNIDHIDLYQMHHFDRAAAMDEIWQAMDTLIQQGKIIYAGSSNFPGWVIAKTNENARFNRRLGLVSEQSKFSLLERRIELEVLPACRDFGVGVIAWSPLAGGLLAKPADHKNGRRSAPEASAERARLAEQLDAFVELCDGLGHPPSRVALAWALHQAGVTSIAIGPATLSQLERAMTAVELQLSPEILAQLDQIFPPCGEAPEAYAW
nr:aldo/keto reductase [Hyphomonas sp. Mor2]